MLTNIILLILNTFFLFEGYPTYYSSSIENLSNKRINTIAKDRDKYWIGTETAREHMLAKAQKLPWITLW